MFKAIKTLIFFLIIAIMGTSVNADNNKLAYDFEFKDLDGSTIKLSEYKNKVIVIVNVASQCGFTNQYEDMQKIWEKYQSKGIVILGVPSNDFGKQEPGSNQDIKNFCEAKFGISFPMTEKVSVKGEKVHPFYQWAKKNYGNGAVPKWNFHKILIDRNGKVAQTFSSMTNPSSKKFIEAIENLI